ncbi:hypothetical protein DPEC_G00304210 [Dallia pectoralis]|uniref:Uncharacterized protein n=1 Tax=Dallia pectoralis TaxID=75939 RepID=A0ACC2FDT1_DALPE|nr:hypothetical protein DPEC_G00304210 [Dallia pectoralis]
MSADISLFDLVNLSIGTPEVGAVNLNALHTTLHAILAHLNIQNVTTGWRKEDAPPPPQDSPDLPLSQPSSPYHHVELKLRQIEGQLATLEKLPTAIDLLGRTGSTTTPVNDMWQLMKLCRKSQANEDGVSKSMLLIQDLLKEIQDLKESRDSLKTEVNSLKKQLDQLNLTELVDRINAVEQCCHRVEDLDTATKELQSRIGQYPDPDDLSQCVSWEIMQTALVSDGQTFQKALGESVPMVPSFSALTAPSPGDVGQHAVSLLQQSFSDGALTAGGRLRSRVAERYPETMEALREVGRLRERHNTLKGRVDELEASKADQTQLQDLQKILADMDDRDMPENLMDQLNHLKVLVDSLMGDRAKLGNLEKLVLNIGTDHGSGTGSETEFRWSDSEAEHSPDSEQGQFRLQINYLRNALQKVLRTENISAKAEQKTQKDSQPQDQLDDLRDTLEDMMASTSSLLSQSFQQEVPEQSQGSQAGGQGSPTCPSCSLDVSKKVSQLFQRYEKLQGLVSGLMKQPGGPRPPVESSELMSDVQGAILLLQAECEKLHGTANHLKEEHSQKQSDIDRLYKSMGKLDEKKADKELVEMEIEIKADKEALDTKVSRMQFDSMTEQLNTMFQDLLSKIIDQEQDWHKVIEKISSEMECKLNRIELDPVKNQLEDRWNKIRKQLQAQPAPKEDDAAGIRMQLVKRFKCISCDRPVDMLTPGPHLVTVPFSPGLPSHKSIRPYTTYELEQVRQHSRSLTPASNQSHFDVARPERSQIQRIHTMMCRQIEKAQNHLREVGYSRFPSVLSPLQMTGQRLPKHERIPEMVEYSYLALSRSCGGSHTMTYPNRRYARYSRFSHTEEDPISPSTLKHAQPEEVGILGFDGQIYKGRLNSRSVKPMDARLPNISSKDAVKSKEKVVHSQSQKSVSNETGRWSPMRPQSAKTQRSRSASGSSVRERAVSSLGCLSQPRSPSHADSPNELQPKKPVLELHVDLSQATEEPVTNL